MRIGILTYFGDLNSGTNMQAYSLQEILRKTYNKDSIVEIINYHAWNRLLDWHPYLTSASPTSLINDLKRLKKYYHFINTKLILTPKRIVSKKPDKVIKFIKEQNYDAIYVGSDTLLELDRYHENEVSAFWLPPEIKIKKFLIAASSKNLEYYKLSDFQKKYLADSISDFSLLGVRDDATARLIKEFTNEKIQIVPDPTFSYNIDYTYVEKYLKTKKINLNKPTICLHLTKETPYSEELATKLKSKGYQIASLRPAYWADILLNDLSPLELVGIFKYFTAVVTHRFHDSIFCFKNKTPVINIPGSFSFANSHGESKYSSLFKQFNVYETNLIKTEKENNTENILQLIDKTIIDFPKETIALKLVDLDASIHKYVEKTKNI